MQQKAEFDDRENIIRLVAFMLLCATAGLVLWAPDWHSHAQQKDRQLVLGDGSQSNADKRIALLIGNGAYTNAPVLRNPPNDARDMAETLSKLGFKVEHGVDLNQQQMKFMIRQFGQKLKAGGQGVFYYAGHGVQSKGRNYLIPVDAIIESEADLEDAGVDVQLMLNYMDDAQNGLNIVILDACRNNPFARSFRSAENGLAQVDAPTGTLIAYATAPGRVASDGTGRNGLYTSELLKQMRTPGLSVTELFMRVRAEVVKQTGRRQVPWEASSLIGTFSFNAATNNVSSTTSKPNPSVALEDAGAVEAEYWESIKSSRDARDYQEYLKEYPQGRYSQLARLKLRQIETARNRRNNTNSNVSMPPSGNKPSGTTAGSVKIAPRAGSVVRNQIGMEMVYVPAGSFKMGTSKADVRRAYEQAQRERKDVELDSFRAEQPQHEVTITEGFYMGRYEVTQAQWYAVMVSHPSRAYLEICNQCPVESVSWTDAHEFIQKLNRRKDGYEYRLPSEAEWEYACRAGTTGDYAGDLDSMGWYGKKSDGMNSYAKTHPVGQKQPNGFGLYDMHGNVWEWCEDQWHQNYNGAPLDGSAWLSGGTAGYRVTRGGSWNIYAYLLRSAGRGRTPMGFRFYNIGLRLVAVART